MGFAKDFFGIMFVSEILCVIVLNQFRILPAGFSPILYLNYFYDIIMLFSKSWSMYIMFLALRAFLYNLYVRMSRISLIGVQCAFPKRICGSLGIINLVLVCLRRVLIPIIRDTLACPASSSGFFQCSNQCLLLR